jgi:hypothetical protein
MTELEVERSGAAAAAAAAACAGCGRGGDRCGDARRDAVNGQRIVCCAAHEAQTATH